MSTICNHSNCKKQARYGLKRECPLRCKTHKENMKSVSRICNCGIRSSFNLPDEKVAICCKNCKTNEMIDITHKKCKCGNQPIYNLPDEKVAICCKNCKTNEMVDVKNKKCKCGNRPSFNLPDEKKVAICCKNCKTDEMIDVKHKKCKCGNQPIYNLPDEKVAICCKNCKTNEMIDVKHKKCIGTLDNYTLIPCVYNQRGNPKYKNYCSECYKRNFPLDPLTCQIRSKTKEITIRDFINENFDGFLHDKTLHTGSCDCTIRRRIDHRKLIKNTLLVIETDENQHKSYDKMDEETRYDDLYMAFSGKWIYIRFNPDKYINKNGKNKNPCISIRLECLRNEIYKQIERIDKDKNIELIERIYMYYDGFD